MDAYRTVRPGGYCVPENDRRTARHVRGDAESEGVRCDEGMHHLRCNAQVPPRRIGDGEDAHVIRRSEAGKWYLIDKCRLHVPAWGLTEGCDPVAIHLVRDLPLVVVRIFEQGTELIGDCSRLAAMYALDRWDIHGEGSQRPARSRGVHRPCSYS
jgi:hypothetical protein